MMNNVYLLDSNAVIRIWKQCPDLLDKMEKSENVNFKISNEIAMELSKKEFAKYDEVPVLSARFIKLLAYVISTETVETSCAVASNSGIKFIPEKNMVVVNGCKISKNDWELIAICQGDEQYALVTDDKNLISSARHVLNASRVLNFDEFIRELNMLKNIP